MHFSNLMRRTTSIHDHSKVATDAIVDALRSRHKAIKALQQVLERHQASNLSAENPDEKDALLATVLFFINFDLIDSGKGGWRTHMKAARALLAAQASNFAPLSRMVEEEVAPTDITPPTAEPCSDVLTTISGRNTRPVLNTSHEIGIRDYIASDSVAYYIWGTTLDCLSKSASRSGGDPVDTADLQHILDRTEANSYHSCPANILLLILRTSRLAKDIYGNGALTPRPEQMDSFMDLLREAQTFDPEAWARAISMANSHVIEADEAEIRVRTCAAATYRATACLYVLLLAPGLQEHIRKKTQYSAGGSELPFLPTAADLTSTILQYLSRIPKSSPLFRYSSWPVFMTGVEANTPESRAWILDRLGAMWEICPWGMMKSAMETLTRVWKVRDGMLEDASDNEQQNDQTGLAVDGNSLVQLRSMGIEFLIV
ncbi:hypothetical protein JX265_008171 [Neoarthrinium moseri]|uniref:Acriflavine sensitivity control protein acr-2 n=1 Tax=Neoarthrinium moseri TaxID=1658444 RepID=A0A9P9WIE2_9PEZI|nr:hypothetical protein JX265_008171 [Neoarthrinium moseri]